MSFEVIKKDVYSRVRTGILHTTHGEVNTPVFLPVGTKGTVKSARNDELKNWGAEMILANTYHLWLQPGDDLIKKAGGLHRFMGWDGPIFTDSGGFQIFSLGEKTKRRVNSDEQNPFNVKVKESGVSFQSGLNGQKMELTPEESVGVQNNLGSDISLVLDEFSGDLNNYERIKKTVERTTRWAKRAKEKFEELKNAGKLLNPGQLQLGIVQGANFPDLRKKSAEEMSALGFEGYCIGGVAVGGETQEKMLGAIESSILFLEENKFRHLLGVGTPENIVQAVARGCDSFDCVIPTREARHGKVYVSAYCKSPRSWRFAVGNGYQTLDIAKSEFKGDLKPLDKNCNCFACQNHSRAYLHHLFKSGEILAIRLLTEHNLRFYLELMAKIRKAVLEQKFSAMAENYKDMTNR